MPHSNTKRDNFSLAVRDRLALRAGNRCTICKVLTRGPNSTPDGKVDIGVAAHIHAAAPGGARYDPSQTSEERAAIENGIYCCWNCSKSIDDDDSRFTAEELREQRVKHEAEIERGLGRTPVDEIVEVNGEHQAFGVGEVTALEIEGAAIIRPGTRVVAGGIGRITGTRIGKRE